MLGGLRDWLVSFDAFGEPVSLNYNGDTTYKTAVGALLSISIKAFLLFFAAQQVLALMAYEDA